MSNTNFSSLFILQLITALPYLIMALPRPPVSPCSHIFTYERIEHAGGDIIFPGRDQPFWKGVVHVPGHILPHGKSIVLRVLLTVPMVLPTKYVGRVEFKSDKERLVEGTLETVKYNVIFPNDCPIPNLLQVRVNDHVLCNGLTPPAPIVTKMILEHTLFPSRINLTARRVGSVFDNAVTTDYGEDLESKLTCGNMIRLGNPLVVGGHPSVTGDWPWLVPIFATSTNGRGVQYQCGGTLVSDSHIVTAAHCFRNIANPGDLVVYVGRRNIRNWADTDSQPRAVKSIIVHPDFNKDTLYSDLAILELANPVVFTKKVYPVCLWNGPENLDLVVGKEATVVGWGTDEANKTKVTSEPKSAKMPIVSQETCLRSSREFYFLSSNRTLCAGARNGSGPCNGDSGSGLYMPIKDPGGTTRWYLRGVVSLSLVDNDTLRCNLNQFAIFTDVAQFRLWLQIYIKL